jgi:hypothetical protein
LEDFVYSFGTTLRKTPEQLKPIVESLKSNWYNSVQELAELHPEDFKNLHIPQRFLKMMKESIDTGLLFFSEIFKKLKF